MNELKSPGKANLAIVGPFIEELPFVRVAMMVVDIDAHFAANALQFADLIA